MPDDLRPLLPTVERQIIEQERKVLVSALQQLARDIEDAPHLRWLDIRLGRHGRRTLRVRLPSIGQ